MSGKRLSALPVVTLVGGTVIALALSFLLGVVLPVTDQALATMGTPRAYTQAQVDGRKLYIREGCFTCHTQMVRDAASDASLGPAMSLPNDYGHEAPNLIGIDRVGPDLTCVGDRESDRAAIVKHLRRPDGVRKGSQMPRYSYLSESELNALAAYLAALTCGGSHQ